MLAYSTRIKASGYSTPTSSCRWACLSSVALTEPLCLEADAYHQPLQTGARVYPTLGSEGAWLLRPKDKEGGSSWEHPHLKEEERNRQFWSLLCWKLP